MLTRLPDDAYEVVSDYVCFVVEDSRITATNVPFKQIYPPLGGDLTVRVDTIVFFHPALQYSTKALVGLIAHELVHSIAELPVYQSDEQEADSQAGCWGFDEELAMLKVEQQNSDNKND